MSEFYTSSAAQYEKAAELLTQINGILASVGAALDKQEGECFFYEGARVQEIKSQLERFQAAFRQMAKERTSPGDSSETTRDGTKN